MSERTPNPIETLVAGVAAGDRAAGAELLPLVYGELRRLAAARLAALPPGQTLQPTALVHEAFVRLVGGAAGDPGWNGRAHFFGAAANAMRRILVDQARRRLADKRGGGAVHEELDMAVSLSVEPDLDILALNEALEDLQATDDGLARVVELRYFAGLTLDETADVLGVSPQSVSRDWTVARAWLSRRLQQGAASGGPA